MTTNKHTALVADDTPVICDLLSGRIARLDFEVRTARSVQEARNVIAEFQPRIIVMDDLGGGGHKLAEELIRSGRKVIWTSSGTPAPSGAILMTKPNISPEKLSNALAEAVGPD